MKPPFHMGALYVDKELKPLSLEEWGTLFEDFSYRLIARTPIGNVRINTVWIGVAVPRCTPFETGIFIDDEMKEEYRHATEEEAIDFHLSMVYAYLNKGFGEYLKKEGLNAPDTV